MRKIIFIALVIVLLTFTIPIVFTKKFETKDASSNTTQENNENNIYEDTQKYTYDKYGTIKLLHSKDGSVEELNIDSIVILQTEDGSIYEAVPGKLSNKIADSLCDCLKQGYGG